MTHVQEDAPTYMKMLMARNSLVHEESPPPGWARARLPFAPLWVARFTGDAAAARVTRINVVVVTFIDDADSRPGLTPGAHAGVVRIAGTCDATFPLNEGWNLEGSKHHTLTEMFNIHNMTKYLTERRIGSDRPNAEQAWKERVPYAIPCGRRSGAH